MQRYEVPFVLQVKVRGRGGNKDAVPVLDDARQLHPDDQSMQMGTVWY